MILEVVTLTIIAERPFVEFRLLGLKKVGCEYFKGYFIIEGNMNPKPWHGGSYYPILLSELSSKSLWKAFLGEKGKRRPRIWSRCLSAVRPERGLLIPGGRVGESEKWEGVSGEMSHSGPSHFHDASGKTSSEAGTPSVEERILVCFLNAGLYWVWLATWASGIS